MRCINMVSWGAVPEKVWYNTKSDAYHKFAVDAEFCFAHNSSHDGSSFHKVGTVYQGDKQVLV